MTTNARALERVAEVARERKALAHPLTGQLAKGRGTSHLTTAVPGGVVLAQRNPARGGPLAWGFMLFAAVALMLWVLGFGLSGIAYLVMQGS